MICEYVTISVRSTCRYEPRHLLHLDFTLQVSSSTPFKKMSGSGSAWSQYHETIQQLLSMLPARDTDELESLSVVGDIAKRIRVASTELESNITQLIQAVKAQNSQRQPQETPCTDDNTCFPLRTQSEGTQLLHTQPSSSLNFQDLADRQAFCDAIAKGSKTNYRRPYVHDYTSPSRQSRSDSDGRHERPHSAQCERLCLSSSPNHDMSEAEAANPMVEVMATKKRVESRNTLQTREDRARPRTGQSRAGLARKSGPDRQTREAVIRVRYPQESVDARAPHKRKRNKTKLGPPAKRIRRPNTETTGMNVDEYEDARLTKEQNHRLRLAINVHNISRDVASLLTEHALEVATALSFQKLRDALNNRVHFQYSDLPEAVYHNHEAAMALQLQGTIASRAFAISWASIVNGPKERLKILRTKRKTGKRSHSDRASRYPNQTRVNATSPASQDIDAQISEFCVSGLDGPTSRTRTEEIVLATLTRDMMIKLRLDIPPSHEFRDSPIYKQAYKIYKRGAYYSKIDKEVCPSISCIWPWESHELKIVDDDLPMLRVVLQALEPSLFSESTAFALKQVNLALRREPAIIIRLQEMEDKEIEEHLQSPDDLRLGHLLLCVEHLHIERRGSQAEGGGTHAEDEGTQVDSGRTSLEPIGGEGAAFEGERPPNSPAQQSSSVVPDESRDTSDEGLHNGVRSSSSSHPSSSTMHEPDPRQNMFSDAFMNSAELPSTDSFGLNHGEVMDYAIEQAYNPYFTELDKVFFTMPGFNLM